MLHCARQSPGLIETGIEVILCIEKQTNQRITTCIRGSLLWLRKHEQAAGGIFHHRRIDWLNRGDFLVRQGFPFIQAVGENIQAEGDSTDNQVG